MPSLNQSSTLWTTRLALLKQLSTENQLSRSLIDLSSLTTAHPNTLLRIRVRPSIRFYPNFSLAMVRSPRFGFLTWAYYTSYSLLAFTFISMFLPLRSYPRYRTLQLIMQKARSRSFYSLRRLSFYCLSIDPFTHFPSQYLFTINHLMFGLLQAVLPFSVYITFINVLRFSYCFHTPYHSPLHRGSRLILSFWYLDVSVHSFLYLTFSFGFPSMVPIGAFSTYPRTFCMFTYTFLWIIAVSNAIYSIQMF